MNSELRQRLEAWNAAGTPPWLDDARREVLAGIGSWVRARATQSAAADLMFVCTHNSRRSHLAQLWAQASAAYLGLAHVRTWSGGTEATAFHPSAIQALVTHGFAIEPSGETHGLGNPEYRVSLGDDLPELRSFSKAYADAMNPSEGFAAVMVCSSADANCPVVFGAEARFSLTFEDPMRSDNTPAARSVYLDTSERIGREVLWGLQA